MDLDQRLEGATTAIDLGDEELAIKAMTNLLSQAPGHPAVLWQVARYYAYKAASVDARDGSGRSSPSAARDATSVTGTASIADAETPPSVDSSSLANLK